MSRKHIIQALIAEGVNVKKVVKPKESRADRNREGSQAQ